MQKMQNVSGLVRRSLLITFFALAAAGVGSVSAGSPTLYMPGPVRPLGGPQLASAVATSSGLFLNRSNETDSAGLAIDGSGGMHLGYNAYGPDASGKQPAYYAHCAANCTSLSGWAITTVSDGTSVVDKTQIALDAAGHPRMLLYGTDTGGKTQWQYAACDANCTSSNAWTVLTLITLKNTDPSIFDHNLHNFGLDPQGRPRFVYADDPYPPTNYVFCDANCTVLANWFYFQLSADTDIFSHSSLTFTRTGLPRLASVVFNSSATTGYEYYLACDNTCTDPTNWSAAPVVDLNAAGTSTAVLRLDGSDRPRLAFYQGSLGGGQGNQLAYLWCDASCANAANWGRSNLGQAQAADSDPDLALDGQGRPRIAYQAAGGAGLGYLSCSANCESPSGNWQNQLAEASSVLDGDWPIAPPQNCAQSGWEGGFRPSLALDSGGNPRVGYDAVHLHSLYCVAGEDYRAVRFVSLGSALQNHLYLPLILR